MKGTSSGIVDGWILTEFVGIVVKIQTTTSIHSEQGIFVLGLIEKIKILNNINDFPGLDTFFEETCFHKIDLKMVNALPVASIELFHSRYLPADIHFGRILIG